jgi:putative sterol carrier protein
VGVAVTSAPWAPDGEVRYQVAVKGPQAVVLSRRDAWRTAQVVLKADYATMAGIASGRLSALDAMASGQARITGNTAALSAHQAVLEALDLVPPSIRASTSF